jgi:adenine-specific DNA methylase
LDAFCGGGVTVVEGVFSRRKVVGVDVNPLAIFVTDSQLSPVATKRVDKILRDMWDFVEPITTQFFVTHCRKTGETVNARWFDVTYNVICPHCRANTLLSNDKKATSDGSPKNGVYECQACSREFKAVDVERESDQLLSVTYRDPETRQRVSHAADDFDLALAQQAAELLSEKLGANELWCPPDEIPLEWDRQQEDCLHRKAIRKFSDLFTARTLYVVAQLFDYVLRQKSKLPEDEYRLLVFAFSAFIRFTNRLTMSTSNWMDGRPVAWAKHAYWIPNQFVEVNPIEYVEKRSAAIKSGIAFQRRHTPPPKRAASFTELLATEATHLLFNSSSEAIEVPSESVDLVLTDPPYGSNVQYGELSAYWTVWIQKALDWKPDVSFRDEAVVNRKRSDANRKDFEFYYEKLRSIFFEVYRVLKAGRPMVFTFNNKDVRSWFAVIKAAVDAGFLLEEDGVIYQDPIENYKNTAHTRHHGTVHGDFVYTFLKPSSASQYESWKKRAAETCSINRVVLDAASEVIDRLGIATTSAVYVRAYAELIPHFVALAETSDDFSSLLAQLDTSDLDRVLSQEFQYDKTSKAWKRNERSDPIST